MRILSLNVALFEANNKSLFDFLVSINADIVCLQEIADKVDSFTDLQYLSKSHIDQATKNLKYSFFGPTWIVKDFHMKNFHQQKSFDFDFGGFLKSGNYIKTKYKISKKSNVFVQNNHEIKVTDWSNWPMKQSQAVQVVDLELNSLQKLRVLNYHGIWTKEKIGNKETIEACRKIKSLARQVNYPVIIIGDFNLFPDTESMMVFKDDFVSLIDEYNISTTRPGSNELSHLERNVIDYILVSKGIKIKSFKVLDSDVSDHLPLVLDFELHK